MGVHGLWQLLHPAGRPVTLESLEGKVLAVDVSIWLHQTMKGMRDKDGNPLPNAHLQGLFSRVCKLLYYRIKPVFVFDGGVPALKKQTLIARRERKSQAENESQVIAQKLLHNLVKSEAVKNALGEASNTAARLPVVRKAGSFRGDSDIFELAPLEESEDIRLRMNAEAWEREFKQQEDRIQEGMSVLIDVSSNSDAFQSLPMEIQHQALKDMKERHKYHSLRQMTRMPEDSDSFSAYQLKKLMKQCNLTTEIDLVTKRMSKKTVNDLKLEGEIDYTGDEVEARRIISEDASHYILIKGMSKEKQREQAERYALESRVKEEKEDDLEHFKGALSKSAGSVLKRQSSKEKSSTSHSGGTKRLTSFNKGDNSSASKKMRQSKRTRNDRREHEMGRLGEASSVIGGAAVMSAKVVSESESDESPDGEDESVEEMSSEDEGFIEVAFDPSQIVEEDLLFPASIFTPAGEIMKGKEHSHGDEIIPTLPCGNYSKKSTQASGHTEKADGGGKVEESGVENVSQTMISCCDRDSQGNKNFVEKNRILEPDAEKRKDVLNDILSQLKKKKEEIMNLNEEVDDNERDGHNLSLGSCSSSDEDVTKGERLRKINDEDVTKGERFRKINDEDVTKGERLRSDDENDTSDENVESSFLSSLSHDTTNTPDLKIDSKTRHIDSDSEDEDLKLAIELSLQTATEDYQCREEKMSNGKDTLEIGNETCVKEEKYIGQVVRDDDTDDEDDDDFDMVESMSDHHLAETHHEQEEDTDEEFETIDEAAEEGQEVEDVSNTSMKKREDLPSDPNTSSEERLQPDDFEIEAPFNILDQSATENMTVGDLEEERNALLLEQGKQARFAMSVTEQVSSEAQELLRLFGIPYIVSPMEAEAQCAYLDITDQTQGTITDDSDIWLFGASRMYKNFFNQNKHIELFSVDSIVSHFGLKREQLINLALLCGSDYTEGIESVGPVRALEIMGEFPGDGLNGLQDFRKWWDRARKNPLMKETGKLRTRLRDLSVIKGFPSQAVADAYLYPVVDESMENFSWGHPDLDLLRQFAKVKFGWSKDKSNQSLEPMMKQLTKNQTQGRIYSYFQPAAFIPSATATARSNRLEKALSRVKGGRQSPEQDGNITLQKKRVAQTAETHREKESEAAGSQRANLKKRRREEGKADTTTTQRSSDACLKEVAVEKEKLKSFPREIKQERTVESEKNISANNPQISDTKKVEGNAGSFHESVKRKKIEKVSAAKRKLQEKIPNVTLETKRKKGDKGPPKRRVTVRSVVCLSESSSSSDSSEDPEEITAIRIEMAESTKMQKPPAKSVKSAKLGRQIYCENLQDGDKPLSKNPHGKNSQTKNPQANKPQGDKSQGDKPQGKKVKTSQKVRNGKSFNDSLAAQQNQTEDQVENQAEGVDKSIASKQVVKNPDVSLINAQTLKATLSYLNQRSNDRKQLLSVLKGGHRPNAIERRIEEEEKRERMAALTKRNLEKQKISRMQEEKIEPKQLPKQLVSFEDTLCDLNSTNTSVKNQTRKSKPPLSSENVKSQKTMKMRQKNTNNRSGAIRYQTVSSPNTQSQTEQLSSQIDPEMSTLPSSKRRTRMRIISDESTSITNLNLNPKQEEGGKKQEKRKTGPRSDSRSQGQDLRSLNSKSFDQPIRQSTKQKSATQLKSATNKKKSILNDDIDSQAEKFHFQIQHVQDFHSVKSLRYAPAFQPLDTVRGRAIAGKGKGVGKNRNGRKGDNSVGEETCVSSQATRGVTSFQIQEYANITADDLGSDFSDSEF